MEDKIYLYYSGDDIIDEVLEKHGEEIKTDTLALSVDRTFPSEDSFVREWNINDHRVKIGVKKA